MACDRAPEVAPDSDAPAEPDAPATPAGADEALAEPKPEDPPTPVGEPAEPIDLEAIDKAAWACHRAKDYECSARLFAQAAKADLEAWKYPYNVACAQARLGNETECRLAFQEALRRGGEAPRERARRDPDMASMRDKSWFEDPVDIAPPEVQPAVDESVRLEDVAVQRFHNTEGYDVRVHFSAAFSGEEPAGASIVVKARCLFGAAMVTDVLAVHSRSPVRVAALFVGGAGRLPDAPGTCELTFFAHDGADTKPRLIAQMCAPERTAVPGRCADLELPPAPDGAFAVQQVEVERFSTWPRLRHVATIRAGADLDPATKFYWNTTCEIGGEKKPQRSRAFHIAQYLSPGETFRLGWVHDASLPGEPARCEVELRLENAMPAKAVATACYLGYAENRSVDGACPKK